MVHPSATFLKSENFQILKPTCLYELLIYCRWCPVFPLLNMWPYTSSSTSQNHSSIQSVLFFPLPLKEKCHSKYFKINPYLGWWPHSIQFSGVASYHSSPPSSSWPFPLHCPCFFLKFGGFFFLLLNKFHPYKYMQAILSLSLFIPHSLLYFKTFKKT